MESETKLPDGAADKVEKLPPVNADGVAKWRGESIEKLPEDLYIPPDALEVFLDTFEGPLDLLLYLIRRQNLDILDSPILQITRQYIQYIEMMQSLRLELAAEYLVMAALLAEIKSRILLPKLSIETEEEGDPRMALVKRLQEYERFKTAAENIDSMPLVGREIFLAQARPEKVSVAQRLPVPELKELMEAFREVMSRAEMFGAHQIQREPLSIRERMSSILSKISQGKPIGFIDLCDPAEGKMGVVVCLLAILELVKGSMIEIRQDAAFAALTIGVAKPQQAAMQE